MLHCILGIIVFVSFVQAADQIHTSTLGVRTRKAMPVSFLFGSGVTLPTAMAAPVGAGMVLGAAPRLSHHGFPEGPPVPVPPNLPNREYRVAKWDLLEMPGLTNQTLSQRSHGLAFHYFSLRECAPKLTTLSAFSNPFFSLLFTICDPSIINLLFLFSVK